MREASALTRLGRLFWRPHEGMIYRPWSKGDEHTGKSCLVKIHTDGQTYDGTFRVADGLCTIHLWKPPARPESIVVPRGRVSIKKSEQTTTWRQPIVWWKTITYDVVIKPSASR